jgi:hypothetical protein
VGGGVPVVGVASIWPTDACAKCAHVVAHHYYSFSVDASKKTQEYTMSCLLCGHGAAVTSFAVPESRAASFPPAAAAVPDPLAAVPLTLQTVGWRPPPLSSTLSSAQEGAVVRDDEWDILDTSATTVKQAPTTAAAGGLAASGLAAGGFAAVTQLAESGDADDLAEDSSVRRPSRGELLASGDASSCRPGQVGLDLSSTLSSLMSRWQDDPKYQAMISAFEASE